MRITTPRRISQGFFLALFVWFCLAAQLGEAWHQLRGWPVNWFLQLDPLAGLATLLGTGSVYRGLLWGLATVVLTMLLGRFFCGWICPFGTLHQMTGYAAHRGVLLSLRVRMNRYRRAQRLKYWILTFMLASSGSHMLIHPFGQAWTGVVWAAGIAVVLGCTVRLLLADQAQKQAVIHVFLIIACICLLLGMLLPGTLLGAISLQTGLLDPISMMHRSINLALLPILDGTSPVFSLHVRHVDGAWVIGSVFLAALLLNLIIPRFFCRFVCPLGALFGVLGRFAPWRIERTEIKCPGCLACEAACEGACEPSNDFHQPECVLCMNCFHVCEHDLITFGTGAAFSSETSSTNLGRRGFVGAVISGAAAVPLMRLGALTGRNWRPRVIRPPGALAEEDFLKRCIKCGQCMRICPTNIIQPAAMESGLEGFWTPILNFRIGTSGCQLNCVACGRLCPTAAIRPITPEEKRGLGSYAARGPIRLGTAFVDRGRCLPWAMGRPCIVCQENCPVSPKAIITRTIFEPVRTDAPLLVRTMDASEVLLEGNPLAEGRFGTGDYYLAVKTGENRFRPRRIVENTGDRVMVQPGEGGPLSSMNHREIEIVVRLQRPFIDPALCIGCGICEHECPVSGNRAIRVSAENESREKEHRLLP